MLKLIAEDFIHLDKIETVLPLYQALIAHTRLEPGCLAYDLYHDLKNPGHFVFIEEWENRAALDAHVQSEHFQRLVPLIDAHKRAEQCLLTLLIAHARIHLARDLLRLLHTHARGSRGLFHSLRWQSL